MSTFQQIFDRARPTLQDDEGDRVKDTEHLLVYANIAMQILARFRNDLFWTDDGVRIDLQAGGYALVDAFPLEAIYEPAMIDYLIARSHAQDDEFSDSGKVLSFFQSANALVRG